MSNLFSNLQRSAFLQGHKKHIAVAFFAVATLGITGCKVKENKATDAADGAVVQAAIQDGAAAAGAANAAAENAIAIDNSLPLELNIGALPLKGNPNAKVTILQFSDFECGFCKRAEGTVDEILNAYPNDVRVAFVNYPLSFHRNAKPAAKAVLAAQRQNKFWEMHKEIFDNNNALNDGLYKNLAQKLGLDVAKFEADMADATIDSLVDQSIKAGERHGIQGTPSFLINGVLLVGAQPLDNFKKIIDEEIKRADSVAADKNLTGEALFQDLFKNAPKPKAEAPEPEEAGGRELVNLENAPVLGDPNALVSLVIFTDFECPFCSRANGTIKELLEKNPGKVKLVFKHNPLAFHKNAKLAHAAAEAAKNQGKFWEYNDLVFENQRAMSRDDLIGHAKTLGLDIDKFTADLDDPKTAQIVENDLKDGEKAGVRGTPHFFLNGTRFSGAQPLNAFQAALDKEIAVAEELVKKGVAVENIYEEAVKAEPTAPKKEEPSMPTVDNAIDIAGAPTKGADDAIVTIIQYSEFQCPFCSRVEPTLEQLLKDYDGKIKIVFKHLPLGFHDRAKPAAEAAMAAHAQGKFWEMHDKLFTDTRKLQRSDFEEYAEAIGLDMEKFKADLDSNAFAAVVDANAAEAEKNGISGTPSFVINGKLFVGAQPLDNFKKVIDAAIEEAEK